MKVIRGYPVTLMLMDIWQAFRQAMVKQTDDCSSIKDCSFICNSYNMGKRDLPDIYAQARGPQARGRGHIYQENPECPCYN